MQVKARRFLVALLSAGAMFGVYASAAQAVGACDSGAFCAYREPNFNTAYTHYEWQGYVKNWPSGIDDDEDSVRNNGTTAPPVQVYDSIDMADPHYCVERNHGLNLPSNKDNDGNSHKWWSGASGCF
jgi:hypothetical protein